LVLPARLCRCADPFFLRKGTLLNFLSVSPPIDPTHFKFAPNTKAMKKNTSTTIGLVEKFGCHSVEELLSALSEDQYHRLVGFARLRLRAATNSTWLQRCFGVMDAEDLVNQAFLKLHLGECNPSLGRHLKAHNRVNIEAFIACVKGIISSDLYNLVNAARNRHEHLFVGDSESEPDAIDPVEPRDPRDLLSRRDLHRVFFKKLYQRMHQPSLLDIVRDWEARSLDDDYIGRAGMDDMNRDLVRRVRKLAREVIAEIETDITPGFVQGEPMSL